MDVAILPLEALQENIQGLNENVFDFKSFFVALQKTPGQADKPLRIIRRRDGGKCMAKFAMSGDDRKKSLLDELLNLQKVQGVHVSKFLWGGEHDDNLAVITEFVDPYYSFHTMRDFAAAPDSEWRSAIFKVLFSLAQLQHKFHGFRHNDLKADNVLVTSGLSSSYSFVHKNLRRTFFMPAGVDVKIIDFELATSEDKNLDSHLIRESQASLLQDYGICYDRCDIYDIHLLIYDVLRTKSSTMDLFGKFVNSFIPWTFFEQRNLTRQFRLRGEDQKKMQEVLGNDILYRMMSHPYFFHFRGEESASTENNITV
jgi:serine/threonine protein kinase